MFELQTIEELIRSYGLALLAPLAVVEGPIVTVIAAYLARLGYFSLPFVCFLVIIADLVGDAGFYALGRRMVNGSGDPPRWLTWFGLNRIRLESLVQHFTSRGGKTIIIGKLTHSAGVAVLMAAGMARMRFWSFIYYNLVATVPKSLFFIAVGYAFGHLAPQVDGWIAITTLVMLILLITGGVLWLRLKR